MMQPRMIGMTCFGCGDSFDVPANDLPPGDDRHKALEYLAGRAGWGIGHWDGQGNIVCGDCTHAVWDFIRFSAPYYSPSLPLGTVMLDWLALHGLVFSDRWTGRDPMAWPPSAQLRNQLHYLGNRLRALLGRIMPWVPAEVTPTPHNVVVDLRLQDGSGVNRVIWIDDIGDWSGWVVIATGKKLDPANPIMDWRWA
jgi:hypothetical protein